MCEWFVKLLINLLDIFLLFWSDISDKEGDLQVLLDDFLNFTAHECLWGLYFTITKKSIGLGY